MEAKRNARAGIPLRLKCDAHGAIQSICRVRPFDGILVTRWLLRPGPGISHQQQELSATRRILVGSVQGWQDERSRSLRDSYRSAGDEFGYGFEYESAAGKPGKLYWRRYHFCQCSKPGKRRGQHLTQLSATRF